VQNAANWEGIDAELRRDCMVALNQSIPDNELIDYYIDYMMRNGLQPIAGSFGRNAAPSNNMGGNNFGGNPNNFGGNNFGGGGGGQYNQNQQMLYQQQPMNQQPMYQQNPNANMNQQPMGTPNPQMNQNPGFQQNNMPLAQPGYNVGQPVLPQNGGQDEFADQLAGLKLGKGD